MENTDEYIDERQKSDVVCRKLMRKIYEIWRKTYEVWIGLSCFCNDVVLPREEKKENEQRWKTQVDDFAERWKEIDEVKEEVAWLIIDLRETIELEEKKRQKKTEKDKN